MHDAAAGHRIWRRRRAGGPRGDGALMRSPLTSRSASCPLVREAARGQGGSDDVCMCKRRQSMCLIYVDRGAARVLLYGIATSLGAEMIFAPIQSRFATESN